MRPREEERFVCRKTKPRIGKTCTGYTLSRRLSNVGFTLALNTYTTLAGTFTWGTQYLQSMI